jgi:hypothetical protein
MDLLTVVEDHLGAVDSWPSYIIYILLVEKPSGHSIRTVSALCMATMCL